MRPHKPVSVACWTCLALAAATPSVHAQGTPIFTETQTLTPPDGGGWFGDDVDISGDVMIVASPTAANPSGISTGAAHIYLWNSSEWTHEAVLYPPDGTSGGYFGVSACIDGDVAVVCAIHDSDPDTEEGLCYIYRYNGSEWEFEAKFASEPVYRTDYGISSAVFGDVVLVGDSADSGIDFGDGKVYVYRYNGVSWEFETYLYGDAPDMYALEFGDSVAIDGDVVMVGAPDGNSYGWVFFFHWDGSQWIRDAGFGDPQAPWYSLGRSVDVKGNLAVAGAPAIDDYDPPARAYVYVGTGAPNYNWAQWAVLYPQGGYAQDAFGEGVAVVDQNTVAVLRVGYSTSVGKYPAYLFRWHQDQGQWLEEALLVPEGKSQGGWPGEGMIAAEAGKVVTGSRTWNNAFYYDISCPGDLNGDRVVDHSDLGILLAAYGVDDGGDLDGDGDTDQSDLGALLANYGDNCP
jgi:hypothetical protein